MEETLQQLLLASCQSQVDLYATLLSGLQVNRHVSALLVALGQTPPVLPETFDRHIGLAVDQLDAAKALQAHIKGD